MSLSLENSISSISVSIPDGKLMWSPGHQGLTQVSWNNDWHDMIYTSDKISAAQLTHLPSAGSVLR